LRLAQFSQHALLDASSVEAFDRITRIATHALGVPTALISLLEPDRQRFASALGLPEQQAQDGGPSLARSFCRHVVASGAALAIEDARSHALTEAYPALKETGVVAYLGVPLWSPEGHALGALCAVDYAPRAWSDRDEQTLMDLAATLTGELQLRTTVGQLERERQAHAGTRSFTAAALDALPDIFFLVDADGRVLRWNQRASDVTGYAPDELSDRTVDDFFAPGDRERVMNAIGRVFHEEHAQVEADLLTKSGDRIPYEFTGALLRDEAGTPLGVCGIGRDVEERRRMQREVREHLHALEQANERFSALVNSTPGVIYQCVYESDGSISFPFLSAPTADEPAPGMHSGATGTLTDAVHPDDADAFWASLETSRTTGAMFSWEGRILQGGVTRWVSAQSCPTQLPDGRTLWNGLALDVTEQKAMEEALRLSEARHRGLIEANPDLFLRLSREGCYLDVQAQDAEELLVRKASELLGHTIPEFLPAPEAERWLAVIEAALNTGRLQRHEYELTTLDGEPHHFEARIVPVGADEVQAIVRDVTDRRRYELGLVQAIEAAEEARARAEEARTQAEEVARLKTSLLTNMSHEIRTPLTGILGFAEVIADEGGEEFGEYARHIGKGGRRLLNTLNSVLDLAQIEASQFPLRITAFDLAEAACDTVGLLRPRAEAKGVALRCDVPDEPLRIAADLAAFDRVVTNLVSNAVKFTDAGSVTVTARALPDSAEAELRVTDTGVGIDASFLPFLFDEFRQESEGESRNFEGSGLGLSITKRLVELMGGTISAESRKGEGSTFTVRLPLHQPADPAVADA
jgi:PAS domain S-box-containing protein